MKEEVTSAKIHFSNIASFFFYIAAFSWLKNLAQYHKASEPSANCDMRLMPTCASKLQTVMKIPEASLPGLDPLVS